MLPVLRSSVHAYLGTQREEVSYLTIYFGEKQIYISTNLSEGLMKGRGVWYCKIFMASYILINIKTNTLGFSWWSQW